LAVRVRERGGGQRGGGAQPRAQQLGHRLKRRSQR
jgi:hypothetical protein